MRVHLLTGGLVVAGLGMMSAGASAKTLTVGIVDYNANALNLLKNAVIPAFEKAHPGVTVDIRKGAWSSWLDNITTWYATDQLPDVMQVGAVFIGALAPQGVIQSIDRFAKNWAPLSDFPKVELEDGTFRGHLYDIPYRLDQRTLVYRKDMFSAAGLDPNAPPADWDQLAQFAKKLTRTDNAGQYVQAGFDVRPDRQEFAPFLFEAGGRFLSDDLTRITVADEPGVVAANFMSDLVNTYDVSPVGGVGGVKTKAAMDYNNASVMAVNEAGIDIGIGLPPKGPANRSGAVFINKWVMGSTTKDPQLAWDWIAFVSVADTMAKLAATANHVPPRYSMTRYDPWSSDPRWKVFFDAASVSLPFRALVPTMITLLNDKAYMPAAMQAMLTQKATPANALTETATKAQALLDDFWTKLKSS